MTGPKYVANSPYCEHQLDPETAVEGQVTCACGKSSDAKWVRELGWLQARSEFVVARINNNDNWYDTAAGASVNPAAARDRGKVGEQLLYVLGALSMLVAVGVFAAVAWESIGLAGQAGILFLLISICTFGAIRFKEKLVGLAGTLAILASTILLTFLLTAPAIGLLPDSYLNEGSWYPLLSVLGVSVLSALAGFISRIAGWIYLVPLGILVSTILFVETVLSANFDFENLNFIKPVIYTAVILGLNRLRLFIRAQGFNTSLLTPYMLLVSAFIAFLGFTSLVSVSGNDAQWLYAIAVIFCAAMLAHLAYRWRGAEVVELDAQVAEYAAPIVAAFGFSVLLSVPTFTSLQYAESISLMSVGLLGSALFLLPMYSSYKPAVDRSLMIFAIALWFIHYFRVGIGIDGFGQDSAYIVAVYFVLISASSLVLWNRNRQMLAFIAGVVAGVFGIFAAVGAAGLGDDVPEFVTVPSAIWLAGMLWLLRKQSMGEMNSGIWLGIPLGTILIPSASVAVANLDNSSVDSIYDWVRFWSVLVLSLAFTILGTSRRITGFLVPGAIAYVLAVFPQLFIDLGLIVPRWVLFAVFGGLLISVAARYERLQALRAETGSWRKVFR